jgi:hypothetical protein
MPVADDARGVPLQTPYMPTKAIKRTRPKLRTSTTRKKENRPIPGAVGPDVKAAGLIGLATCFPMIVDRDQEAGPRALT